MAMFLFLVSLVSAKLYVHDPKELQDKFSKYEFGVIPSSLANFGNPPYGSSLVGRLYVPTTDPDACLPLEAIKFEDNVEIFNHPILLVDRGVCSFVVKVRNAQTIGASAVIIVDNKEESPDSIVMVDDGTAGNIYIPSVLISKADGQILKDHLNTASRNSIARMKITFDMPHPDNRVEYDLWMSSDHSKLREFLKDFAPIARKLGENILLTPHYVMWYCIECSRDGFKTDEPDCISGGRYCAPDPDFDGHLTGRDVIMEDLRQLCIYKYAQQKNKLYLWWNYVEAFFDSDLTQALSEKAMKKVGISVNDINDCISASVDGNNIVMDNNRILEAEKDNMIEKGVFYYPAFIINNQAFRGDMEVAEILVALCAGFSTKPEFCNTYFQEAQSEVKKGISGGTILIIILFSLILLIVILFFYRRWLRNDMNNRMKATVSSAVSQYIALTDQSLSREL